MNIKELKERIRARGPLPLAGDPANDRNLREMCRAEVRRRADEGTPVDELLRRCLTRLRRISDTSDIGLYAKAYTEDVTQLLALLLDDSADDKKTGADGDCG